MLSIRLEEMAAPAGTRDADQLVTWLLDTLGLVRRRSDDWTGEGVHSPLHRLMREYLLAEPSQGWDSSALADELGMSATALHHQVSKLHDCGLVAGVNRDGWRIHHLRNGSLSNAVALMETETRMVLSQRLGALDDWMEESDARMAIPSEKSEEVSFRIVVCGRAPLTDGQDEMDAWMNDLGLYGDRVRRPKDGGKPLARLMFEHMLTSNSPLSLDEALDKWGSTRPRLTRTLDRFRAAGLAERVPRLDRLPVTLWSAIQSQHGRRGSEWLVKKGGLGRMDAKVQKAVLSAIDKGNFTVEACEKVFAKVPAADQMVLLNLLGGRLPVGWRLAGAKSTQVRERVLARVDRTFRRIKRVAEMIEKTYAD